MTRPFLAQAQKALSLPLQALLDLLYPPVCRLCNSLLDDPKQLVCPECRFGFEALTGPLCIRCGQRLPTSGTCPDCLKNPPEPELIRSAFAYGGEAKECVLTLKSGGRRELAHFLAQEISKADLPQWDWAELDILVPVPLHRSRLAQRGFNQAALLAAQLGKLHDLPVVLDGLTRIRATPAQSAGASLAQRRENVARAFEVSHPSKLKDKRVCLVDDVVTSGATLNSCAKTVLESGALRVVAVTAARTCHR